MKKLKFEKAQFTNNGAIHLYIAREGSGSGIRIRWKTSGSGSCKKVRIRIRNPGKNHIQKSHATAEI